MATTEAQKRASVKWMKENQEEIKFRVRIGEKAKIQDHAQTQGKTLAGYIKDLIKQDMEGKDDGGKEAKS